MVGAEAGDQGGESPVKADAYDADGAIKVDNILIFSGVSIAVTLVLGFLDSNPRRHYYFAAAVVASGVALSLWSYQKTSIKAEDFVRRSAKIVSVSIRESDMLVFSTTEGDFLFPGSRLDSESKAKLLSLSTAKEDATIWTWPSSNVITGLETPSVTIDPDAAAVRENHQNRKFINVGLIIAGVGILLAFLHFVSVRLNGGKFAPDVQVETPE